jgi:hypothetical protein
MSMAILYDLVGNFRKKSTPGFPGIPVSPLQRTSPFLSPRSVPYRPGIASVSQCLDSFDRFQIRFEWNLRALLASFEATGVPEKSQG